MRVLITGIDGYLGWPLALSLGAKGHEVAGIDNGLRRTLVKEQGSQSAIPILSVEKRLDIFAELFGKGVTFSDFDLMDGILSLPEFLREFQPDAIVYLGEIPSAPYSMESVASARFTQRNNILGTLNTLFAMQAVCPDVHLIKLGTLGEYGTPDCIIPEGHFPEVTTAGDDYPLAKSLAGMTFPKRANSWYHLSKVHDSNNIEFACRNWGLRSTDIMQGVVYGTRTDEMYLKFYEKNPGGKIITTGEVNPKSRTRFDFDECFVPGTSITCNPSVKNIEDIKVGDNVLTGNGRFKKVEKLYSRKVKKKMIRLKIQGSSTPTECTDQHPFLVVERMKENFSKPKWMSAGEIHSWIHRNDEYNSGIWNVYSEVMKLREKNGWGPRRIARVIDIKETTVQSWCKGQKPKLLTGQRERLYIICQGPESVEDVKEIDCSEFNVWSPNKYTPNRNLKNPLPDKIAVDKDFMYMSGLYLAEASAQTRQTTFHFNPNGDKKEKKFIINYMQRTLGIYCHEINGNITINSTAFTRLMKFHFKSGAYKKRMPQWVLYLPIDKQKRLLDGLYDGDGTNGNHLELCNRDLCESAKLLHLRSGEHASIYYRERTNQNLPDGRTIKKSVSWTCHWRKPKKLSMFKNVDNKILAPIMSSEEFDYLGKVYNIHVKDDHTYVANGALVHNCFGTAIHRFCAQAVAGLPITVHGKGLQKRGFLPLRDSIQCLNIALDNPPGKGEYRVFNQFEEVYSILELAKIVKQESKKLPHKIFPNVNHQYADKDVLFRIVHIENPRNEAAEHYYNPVHQKLFDLGYKPTNDIHGQIKEIIEDLIPHRQRILDCKEVLTAKIGWDGTLREREEL